MGHQNFKKKDLKNGNRKFSTPNYLKKPKLSAVITDKKEINAISNWTKENEDGKFIEKS